MSQRMFIVAGPIRSAFSSIFKAAAVGLMFFNIMSQFVFADHIHHLWYNNSNWQDQDLTALSNGPVASSFGAIASFRTTPNNQLHVYYVDENAQHVHQLYYNGASWSDEDLTAFTGGPPAFGKGMSGFAISNLQYVFYVSYSDLHVHELNYNNLDWSDQDLTAIVGGNTANPYSILAFVTEPNKQFHVYYEDANTLALYQLYFNGTSWTYQDLNSFTGAGFECLGPLGGFAVGNVQHVFCEGYPPNAFTNHLLHIYYTSAWHYEDVTFESGSAKNLALVAPVAGYKVPGVNQLEVYSLTSDYYVNQYTRVVNPVQWIDYDLTNGIGAPLGPIPLGEDGIVAFVTTPNNQRHIYYPSGKEVYQLYYNGTAWSVEDLTGGSGDADTTSGMAGFPIGNLQHVFYLSCSGDPNCR